MKCCLADNTKSREMNSEAEYHHVVPTANAKTHNAQMELFAEAYRETETAEKRQQERKSRSNAANSDVKKKDTSEKR
ncbi:MAG TPA: hypothetical protein DEP65_13435 [Ruminococcus sp.]|nr:hypothetical protein [Ruminococcus sp.]